MFARTSQKYFETNPPSSVPLKQAKVRMATGIRRTFLVVEDDRETRTLIAKDLAQLLQRERRTTGAKGRR